VETLPPPAAAAAAGGGSMRKPAPAPASAVQTEVAMETKGNTGGDRPSTSACEVAHMYAPV
jgi:hypothetical protein